ncbi:DNA/RNA-binding protein KIN17-like [Uloborus diversus]|uniref:DNA/RNA-binding protein KIN17-like n=1 Tax=Uloborus diversus TaxID=327109 RepID=UPI00240A4822|nr:DNA/RNA-binding protein KIN17-like [Uloborus diversus]
MPKHGFLTPKAIANRIKAKGLQKLRWYCQMCQKQCRDENGFKCHTMSESHQRQLLLFAENPDKYVDDFSKEFLDGFVHLLSRRFGTKRVHANQVYQEYIADRNHLHMNATQWETLTDFVKWLGREGHCIVDETEKGWFVTYIDRDPETIRRQEALLKSEKMKLDDEERMAKFFQRQMEKDREKSKPPKETVYTELKKSSEEEKVAFSLKTASEKVKKAPVDLKQNPLSKLSKSSAEVKAKEHESSTSSKKTTDSASDTKKRKHALEEIIELEEEMREKKNRKDHWLAPGIVVKITSKKFGKFAKKKVVVKEVKNNFSAVVELLDEEEFLNVHQTDVETVIPAVGRKLLIVNGAYRDTKALLLSVNFETFSVKAQLISGPFKGKVIDSIKYEDVSKLYNQS